MYISVTNACPEKMIITLVHEITEDKQNYYWKQKMLPRKTCPASVYLVKAEKKVSVVDFK